MGNFLRLILIDSCFLNSYYLDMVLKLKKIFSLLRRNALQLAVLVVVILLGLFWKTNQEILKKPAAEITQEQLTKIAVDYLQKKNVFIPSDISIRGISETLSDQELGKKNLSLVMQNHLPLTRYWQMDQNTYFFHPMHVGGFLSKTIKSKEKNDDDLSKIINRILEVGVDLPNGGIAWYYPEIITTSYIQGPGATYSAISQAELLTGFTHAYVKKYVTQDILEKIIQSLQFDVDQGGVSLDQKAMLEFPLYFSAPEIILNGWLHALLRLVDYYDFSKDENVKKILDSNLQFLSSVIDNFDDEKHFLSKYSDLSPYKGTLKGKNIDTIKIIYRDKKGFINRQYIEEISSLPIKFSKSIYDNQILKKNKNEIEIAFNCSGLFSTIIEANQPFQLTLNTRLVSDLDASMRKGTELLTLQSQKQEDGNYSADVDTLKGKLICGNPTNFKKYGVKNYYHMQHIVALAYLAKTYPMDKNARNRLLFFAKKWLEYTKHHPGKKFSPLKTVFETLDRGKFYHQATFRDIESILK